jgi:hypothetical protein
MNPQYQTQPLDSLADILKEKNIDATILHVPGAVTHKWLPLVTPDRWSVPQLSDQTKCSDTGTVTSGLTSSRLQTSLALF